MKSEKKDSKIVWERNEFESKAPDLEAFTAKLRDGWKIGLWGDPKTGQWYASESWGNRRPIVRVEFSAERGVDTKAVEELKRALRDEMTLLGTALNAFPLEADGVDGAAN